MSLNVLSLFNTYSGFAWAIAAIAVSLAAISRDRAAQIQPPSLWIRVVSSVP